MTILRNPARRPARRRGVTLIEAVLFISIALGLIVGGIVFFQQASTAQRTNDAVRNVSSLASETRALYQSQENFAGVTEQTLIDAGAVPSSIVNNGQLRNEWGGSIELFPVNASGTADDGFMIVYTNAPVTACTRLISFQATGQGVLGSDISHVRIIDNSADVATARGLVQAANWGDVGNATDADGVTPGEAATFCSRDDAAGDDDQDNIVTFGVAFSR